MRPKYKVTGCARFFIFFLFLAPAVFFGATYMRGENGVQIIKEFVGQITGKTADGENTSDGLTKPADPGNTESVEALRRELDDARAEIRALKEKVAEQAMELDQLRANRK